MFISTRQAQQRIEEHQENIGSPRVAIEPQFQARIQKAVDLINQRDPQILSNVTDIIGHLDSGPFGRFTSNNPHTIYVNIQKIENELKSRLAGQPEDVIQKELDNQIVKTLMHEATHQKDVSERGYSSESGADAAEKKAEEFLPPIELQSVSHRNASMVVFSYVRKKGDKWCVMSHKGKSLGCYGSKKAANNRLRQIEFYKNQ